MRTFFFVCCLVATWTVANAQLFLPGHLTYLTLLRDVAPEHLKPACIALERSDPKTARQIFEQEMSKNPNNYLAIFAFLQTTTPAERRSLLAQYEARLTKNSTPGMCFAVALLYAYVAQDDVERTKTLSNKTSEYYKKCHAYLQEAYTQARDPLIAVMIGFLDAPNQSAVVEEQIGRLAGEDVLQAYLAAKRKRWASVAPPKVPRHMNLEQLHYLRTLVNGRWADYTAQRVVNPRTGEVEPLTPEQKRADAYFAEWVKAIDEAIQRRTSQP